MNNNVITLINYYNILSESLNRDELIKAYGLPNVEKAEKIIEKGLDNLNIL